MPELPEVHNFKRYFDETALRQRITEVHVHDDFIIRNCSGADFADRLAGRMFTGSLRRGKYLFAHLDNGHDVLLHFGMTGDLHYYDTEEAQPRFERFAFAFENGMRLGFEDSRKFARILYLEDREAYIREIGLGPDALLIAEADFVEVARGRSTTLKGFLLNQSHLSGVGNLYADEICYRARLHPGNRLDRLSDGELRNIYRHLREVFSYAVENAPYYKEYPENWFWHVWREEGRPGPEGYGVVKKTKIAGRTTYYCEGWQEEK